MHIIYIYLKLLKVLDFKLRRSSFALFKSDLINLFISSLKNLFDFLTILIISFVLSSLFDSI